MSGFDTTLGCFFIGIAISAVFYGFTVAQVVYYARNYKEDRISFKVFVFALWLLDTLTTVLDVVLGWQLFVSAHSSLAKISRLPYSADAEYLVVSVVTLVVQVYYTHAIWRLVKQTPYKLLATAPVIVIALASFGYGIDNTIIAIRDPEIPSVYNKMKVSATVQPLTACIVDIYITVALSTLLQRERTMFRRTYSLINTLTMWAINRGALTAALQTAQAVSYIAASKSVFYWSIFHFAGGKAYVNSVLAILNARHYIRSGGSSYVADSFPLQEIYGTDEASSKDALQGNHWGQASRAIPPGGIMMRTTVLEQAL